MALGQEAWETLNYMVRSMEWFELERLSELMKYRREDLDRAAKLTFKVGDRVQSFHNRGHIHGTVEKINKRTLSIRTQQGRPGRRVPAGAVWREGERSPEGKAEYGL